MKRIKPKRNVYAKVIKDLTNFGYCREVDRTKENHRYKFDVDCRSPSAPKDKRHWIYWGSHHSIEKCREKISESLKSSLGGDAEARIVENKTGLILEIIK